MHLKGKQALFSIAIRILTLFIRHQNQLKHCLHLRCTLHMCGVLHTCTCTFVTGGAELWIASKSTHHHCIYVPNTRLVVALVVIALLTTQLSRSENK